VIGMTQLLTETALSDQQREYVDTVRACGEGLLALINDILDFSRLEAGKVQLESIPFSVRDLAEDAVSVVAPQSHDKSLELICSIGADVPAKVWGDPTRLRQVLLNLLANAVKFTAKGAVVVTVRSRPNGPGAVLLELAVKDTGIGIAPDALPRLFSAFSQEDSSTTRRFGGSGLGLVICKGLTQLMRGSLDVESGAEGSTFKISLPLKVHTQAGTAPDLRGHSVAVLERRPASRAALVAQLLPTGVSVSTPDDAAQLGDAEVVLVDQGFDDRGVEISAQLAAEGRQVGLLRRLDGSKVEERACAFVLPSPVREYRLHQQLERLLFKRPRLSIATRSRVQFVARVLVAEDNRVNQRVVRGLLEKLGCAVTIVDDGEQAVRAASSANFDLVLMDCQMPELDGFEATRKIRARKVQVPIIALTAGVMEGDRERCLAAGMDEFLCKPVRLEELERVLERWCGARAKEAVG
jgi:CheY-like chemotaxis protein